jgi:hypothetical protein
MEVLTIVSDRLTAHHLPFMLTGSFALGYYATPRMTRDLDIVINLQTSDVESLMVAFAHDFYIDADTARSAIISERLFNLMHFASGVKIDFIVRKSSAYRQHEFARRRLVSFGSVTTWIVSREDLILSKLAWAATSGSEMQLRDVRLLLTADADVDYLNHWAPALGVQEELRKLLT